MGITTVMEKRKKMTNIEVIQTMTVKELANLLNYISGGDACETWLKEDSQESKYGLLTDRMKPIWKVH